MNKNEKWSQNFSPESTGRPDLRRPGMFRRGDYSRNRGCAIACIVGALFWVAVALAVHSCMS